MSGGKFLELDTALAETARQVMKIHPTAIVDPSAEIAEGAIIGPYCWLGPNVAVGEGTELLHHVSVMASTRIGRENLIHPGAVLGGDPQDKKYQGETTWLHIGDRNVIREHVTMHRGTGLGGGDTRLGDDCLIMAGCHIAHDCILGNHVTMANACLLGGHIVVEDGAGFGGMSAVHHFVSVGQSAFIGGMTRLYSDAPPYMVTEGNPSRVRGTNRVGLLRRGISQETRNWLKEAFRTLFHEGSPKEEAIQKLRAREDLPAEGDHLLTFMEKTIAGKTGRALQP